ncbi:hypothetical protein KEM54_002364 [Ascosphaera aggregata]|nr:hypothetical protein KEM54_002364 [Ascosphaera aggregata]
MSVDEVKKILRKVERLVRNNSPNVGVLAAGMRLKPGLKVMYADDGIAGFYYPEDMEKFRENDYSAGIVFSDKKSKGTEIPVTREVPTNDEGRRIVNFLGLTIDLSSHQVLVQRTRTRVG